MARGGLILITILIIVGLGLFFYNKLPPEEIEDPLLEKIKGQGKILVGVAADYPPMESIDSEGNFFGMDIDIAKEISFDLGVEPEFRNIDWEELFDAVRGGEVDMIISAITITSERAKIMSFSDPYFNAGQIIVIRLESKEIIKGKEDLRGYSLGVEVETTSEETAKELTDPFLVKSYENYDLAKKDLLEKKIDAIIIDYPAAVGMTAGEENLEMVGEPFTQEFYGVATQKNQKVLLSEINRTIRRLKTGGELKRLEERWLAQ